VSVSYRCDRESGVLHTEFSGDVKFDEVMGHFRDLEADASLPKRLDVLLDLSQMESLPESAQLRSVAGEVGRLREKLEWGTWAIVAPRDALFGMLRIFEVFTEGKLAKSRVFRDRADAEDWLESERVVVPD
jgi:hypothetical protein